MNNLAQTYRDMGRLSDALPLFEEALKRQKAGFSADHAHTLIVMPTP